MPMFEVMTSSKHESLTLSEPTSAVLLTAIVLMAAFTLLSVLMVSSKPLSWGFWNRQIKLPGPSGVPIFGNLLQLRAGHSETLTKWGRKYGGMFRLQLGQREAVILTTQAAVAKTLVQQGTAFQNRPTFHLWHNVFASGGDTGGVSVTTMGTTPYSPATNQQRRNLVPHLQVQKLPKYNHFSSRRYEQLVQLLSRSCDGPVRDLGSIWWVTAVGIVADQIFGVRHPDHALYGMTSCEMGIFALRSVATPVHDYVPLVHVAEVALGTAHSVATSALKRIGLSLPSLGFDEAEARANSLRDSQSHHCRELLADLHKRLDAGDETSSVLGDLFRGLPAPMSDNEEFRLATTMAGTGLGTGTMLTWLFGRLSTSPELQEAAFQAIQEVYGGEAPDPNDSDRVEYIKALGLEAGRYFTPVRVGFPRETYTDAVVDGVLIPKGTLVVYDSYQINRDPAVYDYPEEFRPERWTEGRSGMVDSKDAPRYKLGVPHLGHGAGRRVCIGMPTVHKSLYGLILLSIHFFKFERAPLDDEGKTEVYPSLRAAAEASWAMDPIKDQTSTVEAQSVPFAAGIRVTPRDPEAVKCWLTEGCKHLDLYDAPALA